MLAGRPARLAKAAGVEARRVAEAAMRSTAERSDGSDEEEHDADFTDDSDTEAAGTWGNADSDEEGQGDGQHSR